MTSQEINTKIDALDKAIASKHTTDTLRVKLEAKKKEFQALLSQVKEIKVKEKKATTPVLKSALKSQKKKVEEKSKAVKKSTAALLETVNKKIADFNRGRNKSSLKNDARVEANKPGKHKSASGKTYYESRPDHTDISPKHKLAGGGALYDTKEKRIAFLKKKGSLITFKEPFYPAGTAGGSKVQVISTGVKYNKRINGRSLKNTEEIKIVGQTTDSPWFKNMDALLEAIDWEKMEAYHSFASGGRIKSALMRDRKYTSQQEWEKSYKRKGTKKTYAHHKAKGGVVKDGGNAKGEKKAAQNNFTVFGYETRNLPPAAVASFTQAREAINNEGNEHKSHADALRHLAMTVDDIYEIKNKPVQLFTRADVDSLTAAFLLCGVYAHKTGHHINLSFLNSCMSDIIDRPKVKGIGKPGDQEIVDMVLTLQDHVETLGKGDLTNDGDVHFLKLECERLIAALSKVRMPGVEINKKYQHALSDFEKLNK